MPDSNNIVSTINGGENKPQPLIQGTSIKLLSYNIQVGIASNRPHHYITRSWKHVFPHAEHFHNLDRIAKLIRNYDVVGLQEVDAGSLRSSFVNQATYLAERAGFDHWYQQRNRNIGHIARHSNGLLSRYPAMSVENHKLPGRVPGRGAMVVRYGTQENTLVLVLMHLALGRRARMQQLEYITEVVGECEHVVIMGDLNCMPESDEMYYFLEKTGLTPPAIEHTFPSWSPNRMLDHILVSRSLRIENVRVLKEIDYSDHLPISMEVVIPEAVQLVA